MNIISFCNKVIEYSFYSIFLLVPLVFAGNTSELFEFNKMWVAFVLTIFIATAWFTKMTLERKISIQRTPLDIPIILFLLSQTISTIFSLDQHVSWWGYYSRFNGGLASTITYIFLYYAFVSNLEVKHVLRTLKVTLFGALIVALWGLPSHFGYDPTCYIFRGTLDTTCWTEAFRPTVRVFSTLGQPAWLSAYLATLIPLAIAFFLKVKSKSKNSILHTSYFLLLIVSFYLNLVFTNTRAGFYAFIAASIVFWLIILVKKLLSTKDFLRHFILINGIFLLCTFLFGIPIDGLRKYTYSEMMSNLNQRTVSQQAAPTQLQPTEKTTSSPAPIPSDSGITDSGNIRLYVWRGAIDAWKANPLFGTGVETFAFAYYKFRPTGHNLTTEWDYLYNKAHNEYLNYLTTTGLFGLGTYLFFIGLLIFQTGRRLMANGLWQKDNEKDEKNHTPYTIRHTLTIGLFSGWISILISNFFGFSVVIINIFLFLIPIFIFILNDALPNKKLEFSPNSPLSTLHSQFRPNPYQWTTVVIIIISSSFITIGLIKYWYADVKYALGYNLDRVNAYQDAYPLLLEATKTKPNEPVYKDELSINMAVLATGFAQQNDSVNSQQFASNAIDLSNQVTTKHPNNVVFWKNRVRLFYTLAQANPNQQLNYYQEALRAIEMAYQLAPTDAKINYNLGVLYGQTGNLQKGVEMLEKTIKLKPDYRDPYFALGLFYHQAALDQNNKVIHPELQQKAIEALQFILKNINPNDGEVKKTLEEWGAG